MLKEKMNNIINNIDLKKIIKSIVLIVTTFLFIYLVHYVFSRDINNFDVRVYNFISKISSTFSTNFFKIITHFAEPIILFILCVIIFIISILFKNRNFGICMSINMALIGIVNQILKHIFARQRPVNINLIDETGYSFPSGHSMGSLAFYGYLIYLVHLNIKNKKLRYFLYIFISVLLILVGTSRIYLGVHYASDVLAGFCFSIAYLIVFCAITKKYIKKGE